MARIMYMVGMGMGPSFLALVIAMFFLNRNAIFESFLLMVEGMPFQNICFYDD